MQRKYTAICYFHWRQLFVTVNRRLRKVFKLKAVLGKIDDRRLKKLGFFNFQQLKRRQTVEMTKQKIEMIKRRKSQEHSQRQESHIQSKVTLVTDISDKPSTIQSKLSTYRLMSHEPTQRTERESAQPKIFEQ